MITKNNTVTQRIEFDCVYLVQDILSHKYMLQGCRYLVEATVQNTLQSDASSLVYEFKMLRAHLSACVPNHTFLYYHKDLQAQSVAATFDGLGVPTKAYSSVVSAETICEQIALQLQATLDAYSPGVVVTEMRLRENADSYATYTAKC